MQLPEECRSIEDVRAAIDSLDHQIVALIGQRAAYVRAAARFKTSTSSVRAPERQAAMLEQRRQWAVASGLSPDMITRLYQELISYFVGEEMQHWQERNDHADSA